MAQINQIPSVPLVNAVLTYKNYGVTDIAEGTAVAFDSSNKGGGSASSPRGIIVTAGNSGCIGFTTSIIKAGGTGPVIRAGLASAIAGGTFSQGAQLMCNASGQVIAQTSGLEQVGRAEQDAVLNDRVAVWISFSKNA